MTDWDDLGYLPSILSSLASRAVRHETLKVRAQCGIGARRDLCRGGAGKLGSISRGDPTKRHDIHRSRGPQHPIFSGSHFRCHFPTEICLREPFATGVKELPVHLNISSLLFTPQTLPSEPADTYFSSPAICRQPSPVQVKTWFLALTPQIFFEFPTEICLREPFATDVKELPVHLNISSLLFTPQTLPSEPADTYFSSPAIGRQPSPVQVKIWFLALTPQIFFEFPTEICLREPFATGVKELPVHLNISSLLFTPQTLPSELADTYFSSPTICRQPSPVQVKIWSLALTPQILPGPSLA